MPASLWALAILAVLRSGAPGVVWSQTEARFATEVVVGKHDSSLDADLFSDIRTISVAGDGTLFVADHLSSEIRSFSSDGEHLRTLGSRGSAPGEFSHITSMVALSRTEVLVADKVFGRFTRLSSGDPLTARMNRTQLETPKQVAHVPGKGYLFLTGPEPYNETDQDLFREFDEDLNFVGSFGNADSLGISSDLFTRTMQSANAGSFDMAGPDTLFFAPFFSPERLHMFVRNPSGGWATPELILGAERGEPFELVAPRTSPNSAVMFRSRFGDSAGVIHSQSIGLHVADDGLVWSFSLLRIGESRRIVAEVFDPIAKVVAKTLVFPHEEFPDYAGIQAPIEARGYHNGRFYLIDESEHPKVRVVRVVE